MSASVKREKENAQKDEADGTSRIDPDDMGCGQRCYFTYGQMCMRASELFNCCLTDYEEAMQKERRWEETVRLKERVLKQRDHLVRLEREQKQLTDRMTAFQTDTTELIEETGENVRKELKKAFRMEVDISTKELMRKHERLAKEQNGMSDVIEEHEEKLGDLSTRTDKIKRELNETYIQLQEVDEDLKAHKESTARKFVHTDHTIEEENERINHRIHETNEKLHHTDHRVGEETELNHEQNQDLSRIKKALEAMRLEKLKAEESDDAVVSVFTRIKNKAQEIVDQDSPGEPDIYDEDENLKPKKDMRKKSIAGKMKMFMGGSDSESEMELPDVPEEPVDRPLYYEYMIHTPSEGETPSEYDLRQDQNETISKDKTAEAKMVKRKLKKRAKRKKMAEQEKTLKKKSTKIAAAGGGGASLPAHVTNA